MPRYKELHYFAKELQPLWKFPFRSPDEYFALFQVNGPNGSEHKPVLAAGEAASLYLYAPSAPQAIHQFDPAARLVITLRSPVDFVYSYHQLNLALRREDQPDFYSAWASYEERKAGRSLPKGCRVPEIVLYKELGLFGAQVRRWMALFPREQIKIILLEDIAADMRAVYQSLEAFLGVPDDGRVEFPQVNENFTYRSKLAQRVLHPTGKIYRGFVNAASHLNVNTIERIAYLHKRVTGLFSQPLPRQSLPPAVRAEVLDFYREDIALLSHLIERDLSHWLA
jgi:hypothetical protein